MNFNINQSNWKVDDSLLLEAADRLIFYPLIKLFTIVLTIICVALCLKLLLDVGNYHYGKSKTITVSTSGQTYKSVGGVINNHRGLMFLDADTNKKTIITGNTVIQFDSGN